MKFWEILSKIFEKRPKPKIDEWLNTIPDDERHLPLIKYIRTYTPNEIASELRRNTAVGKILEKYLRKNISDNDKEIAKARLMKIFGEDTGTLTFLWNGKIRELKDQSLVGLIKREMGVGKSLINTEIKIIRRQKGAYI